MIKQLFTSPLSREEMVVVKRCFIIMILALVGIAATAHAQDSVVMVKNPTASESIIARNLLPPPEKRIPYDNKAKWAAAGWYIGSGADIATTLKALDRGCKEANPLYGEKPSAGKLILATIAVSGLMHWVAEYMDNESRAYLYGIPGAIRGLAAVHNANVKC